MSTCRGAQRRDAQLRLNLIIIAVIWQFTVVADGPAHLKTRHRRGREDARQQPDLIKTLAATSSCRQRRGDLLNVGVTTYGPAHHPLFDVSVVRPTGGTAPHRQSTARSSREPASRRARASTRVRETRPAKEGRTVEGARGQAWLGFPAQGRRRRGRPPGGSPP